MYCPETFQDKISFENHVKTVHHSLSARTNQCNICGQGFESLPKCRKHMSEIHGIERKKEKCDNCQKEFKTIWDMKIFQKPGRFTK